MVNVTCPRCKLHGAERTKKCVNTDCPWYRNGGEHDLSDYNPPYECLIAEGCPHRDSCLRVEHCIARSGIKTTRAKISSIGTADDPQSNPQDSRDRRTLVPIPSNSPHSWSVLQMLEETREDLEEMPPAVQKRLRGVIIWIDEGPDGSAYNFDHRISRLRQDEIVALLEVIKHSTLKKLLGGE